MKLALPGETRYLQSLTASTGVIYQIKVKDIFADDRDGNNRYLFDYVELIWSLAESGMVRDKSGEEGRTSPAFCYKTFAEAAKGMRAAVASSLNSKSNAVYNHYGEIDGLRHAIENMQKTMLFHHKCMSVGSEETVDGPAAEKPVEPPAAVEMDIPADRAIPPVFRTPR
jgi:hypothetical protein